MAHKKNEFWTFIFSLLPGAGEMYLGFMKQGVSLMALFFGLIALCAFFRFDPGLFILPIVWFYGFFHVHNLNGLSDEEFSRIEDDYLIHLPQTENSIQLSRKKQLFLAYFCIFLGIYALLKIFLDAVYELIPNELYYQLYDLTNMLPQIILSIVLIVLGIHLVHGKKVQLEQEYEQNEDD